ncbi:MAG: hypothetical protein V1495_05585, partial [Pseudomonadota bacterium]
LMVDGSANKKRGNPNLGFSGQYFIDENLALGARFGIDVRERSGVPRKVVFAPGLEYAWLTASRFSPFFSAGLPMILEGAANTRGSSAKKDLGISAGFGLRWNLGGAIGIPNTLLRYDFNLDYMFGVGSAASSLALELFALGIDYRF